MSVSELIQQIEERYFKRKKILSTNIGYSTTLNESECTPEANRASMPTARSRDGEFHTRPGSSPTKLANRKLRVGGKQVAPFKKVAGGPGESEYYIDESGNRVKNL